MAQAVKNLEARSSEIAKNLNEEYSEFFEYLSNEVIGVRGSGNGAYGDESRAPAWIAPYTKWESLTPEWMNQKNRIFLEKSTPGSILDFYQGITAYMGTGGRRRKISTRFGRKGSFRKKRANSGALADFVEGKSKEPGITQKLFGNLQLDFSLVRPDFGKVKLAKLKDAIKVIEQRTGKASGKKAGAFASAMDGTKLIVTIYAFNKIDPDWNESALVDYLIRRDGNKEQWGKINAKRRGNTWRIRPVILPLINWYLQVGFKNAMPKALNS